MAIPFKIIKEASDALLGIAFSVFKKLLGVIVENEYTFTQKLLKKSRLRLKNRNQGCSVLNR